MPPIPILILLSIAGLFIYLAIGALVGFAVAKVTDYEEDVYMRTLAGVNEKGSGWGVFGRAAALWPIVLALAVGLGTVAGVLFVVLVGPIWCCGQIGKYLAATQIKEPPDAA